MICEDENMDGNQERKKKERKKVSRGMNISGLISPPSPHLRS